MHAYCVGHTKKVSFYKSEVKRIKCRSTQCAKPTNLSHGSLPPEIQVIQVLLKEYKREKSRAFLIIFWHIYVKIRKFLVHAEVRSGEREREKTLPMAWQKAS